MRRFLLFLGSLGVGMAGLILLSTFVLPGSAGAGLPSDAHNQAIAGGVIVFVIALAVGLLLSAPFVLRPPDTNGFWSITLPIYLALMLLLIRLIAFAGYLVLCAIWWMVFRIFPRPAPPVFQTYPPRPVGYPGPVPAYPQVPAGPGQIAPASWQRDPTGRYPMRYWNGTEWTDRVANGSMVTTDAI
jgi:Protein of unknown function (DUF2510)